MGSNERDECMNEIRLLQSMHHPHIIDYLSCVIEHNELTVVMELVPAHIAPPLPNHRKYLPPPPPQPAPRVLPHCTSLTISRRRLRMATWRD